MENKYLIHLSERFYTNDNYKKAHITTSQEIVSLDVGLFPIKKQFFVLSDIKNIILSPEEQVIIACNPNDIDICKYLENYEFCGYDIVDTDACISLLTNLIEEKVLKIINKYNFNKYNLLNDTTDANKIINSLTAIDIEHCASPSIYAIYRITK